MSKMAFERPLFPPYHSDIIYNLSPAGRQFANHCRRVHEMAETTIRNRRFELAMSEQSSTNKSEDDDNVGRKRGYLDFLDILLKARVCTITIIISTLHNVIIRIRIIFLLLFNLNIHYISQN